MSNTVKCYYLALGPYMAIIKKKLKKIKTKSSQCCKHTLPLCLWTLCSLSWHLANLTHSSESKCFKILKPIPMVKTINQSTALPKSLLFPSKHARSDSHFISIGSEALAWRGAKWSLHTGVLPDWIRLTKTWQSQPNLIWPRLVLHNNKYDRGHLWKKTTESESGNW